MAHLLIFRHGQSLWNLENKFTGWVDVELTEKGIEEAKNAGLKIKNFSFDFAYSSNLIRAQKTLEIALKIASHKSIPIIYNESLNERMYGDLQGLNKTDTVLKYGEEQVKLWRRSYDIAPPNGESLKDTADRVIPYFKKEIMPKLMLENNVIIVAHGNSLRALIMHLENMTADQILEFEIITAQPRFYNLDNKLNVLSVKNL